MPDSFPFQSAPTWTGGPIWIDRMADWIKARPRMILGLGILLQLLVLAAMIVVYAAPLVVGERIWLHVRPVDPRDYFRGDYVVLSYDFSLLPASFVDKLSAMSQRQGWHPEGPFADVPVYAVLEPEADGKHYHAVDFTLERPTQGRYLRGKFTSSLGGQLQFGIEAFYVQEGEGLVLEKLRNAGQLSAEIALAPWGQATLCRLR